MTVLVPPMSPAKIMAEGSPENGFPRADWAGFTILNRPLCYAGRSLLPPPWPGAMVGSEPLLFIGQVVPSRRPPPWPGAMVGDGRWLRPRRQRVRRRLVGLVGRPLGDQRFQFLFDGH